ncbi:MAG: GNAT family N-acetyltransferase [Massilia sp.]
MDTAVKSNILRSGPDSTLRPVRAADAPALAKLVAANAAHLSGYLPKVASLANLPEAQRHVEATLAAVEQGDLLEWHIFTNEILCGAIRLHHIDTDNRKAAIACYLGADHLGRGLATASVRTVLQYAFGRLALNRIELVCASENMASQRLAERLGFRWEGLLRQAELIDGAYLDHFVYGLLREDFAANVAPAIEPAPPAF